MANTPVNKDLYNRVKAEAKRKFKSWPSAYGSAWLVKEYKKRGGKYRTSSKQFGGMSDTALDKMQTFYKDMQANKYNPSLMQNSLDDLSYFNAINPRQTYLKKIKSGTGETLYKGPGLFSKDDYVIDKNINIQTHFDPQGERLYKNIYELDQPGFATTSNLDYGDDVPEGTQYMMDIYGNDYSVRPPEMKTGGEGIPERYKNMGFTKVGAKKKSTRPGKKWMVLAKKGDDYKVVHGGDNKMQDFKQHGSAERKKRFWDRMGGRDSAKANDPFSPLYWHKRFGTWQEGGQFIYDPNNPMPQFEMGNSILNKMKRETMRKGGQPCYECGGMYATGGTNNPGFRALPPHVQQKIRANMNSGGMTPFNADPNYYGERLEKFIGNIRNTAAENLFPDMEEEVMQMPQARYGMPIYQTAGSVNDPSANLIDTPMFIYDANGNRIDKRNLTYGDAVFDSYGNLLGGYYRDGKMNPRRPGRTYNIPNSDQTVTINQNNELIYNQSQSQSAQTTPTNTAEESGTLYLYDGDGNPIRNINDVAPGTQLYGPPAGGSVPIGTYRGNGQFDTTAGINGTPVTRNLAEAWPEFSASYPQQAAVAPNNQTIPEATGSATRPTVAERFETSTGLDWREARRRGLTDGTANANRELVRRLEAGETIEDIEASMRSTAPTQSNNTTANNNVNNQTTDVDADVDIPEIIDEDTNVEEQYLDDEITQSQTDEEDEDWYQNTQDLYENTQGMYSDPDTGLVMNVPQQYFGQQYMPQYPQYNNPYLQRAQYKFGPLGRNLRKVDLQYGIPGQQSMMPADIAANAANVIPEAIIEGMQNSGMISPREGRRAMKKAIKEMRQASKDKLSGMREASRDLDREERMTNKAARFENRMQRKSDRINDRFDRKAERIQNRQERRSNNKVNNYSAPTPSVPPSAPGSYSGPSMDALQRQMEAAGIKYSSTPDQRFEGYQLYRLPDGQYEYRPTKMYGGSNPYLYMYKQGGEYYMDEDTINMILAMGGDIEFLD